MRPLPPPKLCKDCKHFQPAMGVLGMVTPVACKNPLNMTEPDLVMGNICPKLSPYELRQENALCSLHGEWHERKA